MNTACESCKNIDCEYIITCETCDKQYCDFCERRECTWCTRCTWYTYEIQQNDCPRCYMTTTTCDGDIYCIDCVDDAVKKKQLMFCKTHDALVRHARPECLSVISEQDFVEKKCRALFAGSEEVN